MAMSLYFLSISIPACLATSAILTVGPAGIVSREKTGSLTLEGLPPGKYTSSWPLGFARHLRIASSLLLAVSKEFGFAIC